MAGLKIKSILEKYFQTNPRKFSPNIRVNFQAGKGQSKVILAPIHQVHGILGGNSYSAHESGRMPMLLLMNLLGGPGMSSKLNLEIREKRGICYQIEANYSPFSDTGLYSIYFGTDTEKHEKCLELIYKELNHLKTKSLSQLYLHQSKARLKGQIALADENHSSVLISLCKSIQDYGYADSIQEIFRLIDKITIQDLLEVANSHFQEEKMFSLLIKPQE